MPSTSTEIGQLLRDYPVLALELIGGERGLARKLETMDVNRPGLALAGFFENFASERIQVFGRGECAYLQKMPEEQLRESIQRLFSYEIPALVFTHSNIPPDFFKKLVISHDIPLLRTSLTTHTFITQYMYTLREILAPRTILHGVLIDVFGVGILLMGASGIGKSESALELIERGHRLVADDVVQVVCLEESSLFGMANGIIQHNMELRGLGIVNVRELFGIGAIRERYPLDLVVALEDWRTDKEYERLGLEEEYMEILGIKVRRILLPVRPGRNIPVLIETAAINHRSHAMGYHAARNLTERIAATIQAKSAAAKKF